jgi:hypothetical protein
LCRELRGQHHAPAALPPGSNLGAHRIGWVGPDVGLEDMDNRNVSWHCRNWNPGSSSPRVATLTALYLEG